MLYIEEKFFKILIMAIINDLEFKGIWRSYQQRVLDELNVHLNDNKLNVVAAPGAGKTTLGIEVMTRLGHNTLILAPTITIRNQWKQRILEGFLPDGYDRTKISTNIKELAEITVSTYQALHTIYKMPEEKEKFLTALKKNKIKTLVLDESHHLRTEWYLTLDKLCEYLDSPDFTTVSLTGTPPYDVSPEEWNNYHTLCGPVDAEISIPELVKNGDLCPHQDLIYFSDLTKEEEKTVYDFEKNRSEFFRYIERQSDFQHAIEMSKFVQEQNPDLIFKNTGFTLSVISYLLSADKLSIPAKILTEFMELDTNMIPSFDIDIAKTLIDGVLSEFEPYFENAHIIKNKLKELKLLNGNKADLKGEVDFKKLFARSVNKLDAIKDITEKENAVLKNKLREVVLLDYIGKGDNIGLNIFSVFDKLINSKVLLGILTGTLIVIPESAKEELYKILDERKIASDKVLTTKFKENYLRVETYGEANIVSVITELFEKGEMNVLIGTAALLGEGWDSPSVNTLIIASVVGSFMLSNQMRGRALRIDKNNPEKSSNIWHLVSLTGYEGVESPDFLTVTKRFNTFEGISYKDNQIQNGISRLGKTFKEFEVEDCKKLNDKMFEYAKGRFNLKNKWEQVFKKSKINEKNMTSQMYEIIETDTHLPEVIENEGFMRKFISDYRNRQKVDYSKFEQLKLAQAILKTLCDIDEIKTPYENITIETDKTDDGKFSLIIVGCTSNERNIFVKSFCEVFSFDDSTRYILKITRKVKEKEPVKETFVDDYLRERTVIREKTVEKDVVKYLPVPNIIGTHQNYVKIFTKNLKGERVEKEKNKNKNYQLISNSCLYVVENNESKKISVYHENAIITEILISSFPYFVRGILSELNKKNILKTDYLDIEIGMFKDRQGQFFMSFFNCSDYETNLIINNLSDMFLKKSLRIRNGHATNNKEKTEKVKKEDGITYLQIPQKVYINPQYKYEIKYYLDYYLKPQNWMPDLSYRKKQIQVQNSNALLLESKIITGVISAIPSIGAMIGMTSSYGTFGIDILGTSAVLFFLIYIFTLCPIDFICESAREMKEGKFGLGVSKAIDKYELLQGPAQGIIYAVIILLFIAIVHVSVVLPMRALYYPIYKLKNPSGSNISKKRLLQVFVNKKSSPLMEREIVININMFNNLSKKIKNKFNDIITKIEYSKFNKENDLSKNATIEMLYTKSAKNRLEVLKARYNAWLNADISRSRRWM